MIRCPDTGALRAALDGERPDVEPHLTECESCRARSAAAADDAALAAALVTAPPVVAEVNTDAALAQVRERLAPPAEFAPPRRHRFHAGMFRFAAGLAVVVLTTALLATPGGRAAAAALLERFRAERVAAVPVDVAALDPTALEALADVAEVDDLDRVLDPQPVADLDAAAEIAGFAATPLDPDVLPPTVSGPIEVLAQAPQVLRATFPDHRDVPADLRSATLVLHLPGAVIQTAGGDGSEAAVMRGEAGSLEVAVEGGPSLAEVRDALLSLPGLPAETVAALRAIEDWETTLPLPVPVGEIAWSETTVDGRPALAFGDESGLGSALLWHDGERFVGVGGTLPLSALRELAEGGG